MNPFISDFRELLAMKHRVEAVLVEIDQIELAAPASLTGTPLHAGHPAGAANHSHASADCGNHNLPLQRNFS